MEETVQNSVPSVPQEPDKTAYISISEYANKYECSKVAVYEAIKAKRIQWDTAKVNGKTIKVVQDVDFTCRTKEQSIEKGAILARSPLSLLRHYQDLHGGSVSKCAWIKNMEGIDVSLPAYQDPTIFVDTVFVAFPSTFVLTSKTEDMDSVKVSSNSNLQAREYITANLSERQGGQKHYPFDAKILTDIPQSKPFVIDNSTKILDTAKKINDAKLATGDYWGYQVYRVSTCNSDKDFILKAVHDIANNVDGKGLSNGNPIYIYKVDVTSNVPGAVEPIGGHNQYAICHMEAKDNHDYVGDCCQTYVVFDGKAHSKENKNTSCIPFNVSKIEDVRQEIENAPLSTRYSLLFNRWLEDQGKGTTTLEVKIYDKARFQMEVGAVESTIGSNLEHFLSSPQENIREHVKDNLDKGMGRVETRFLGAACFIGKDAMLKAHRAFVPLLSSIYLHETPVNWSIESFMHTLKATTSMVVEGEEGKDFFAAHWQNGVTGKITGIEMPRASQERIDYFINYCTIRHVPHIHFILSVEDEKGANIDEKDIQEIPSRREKYGKDKTFANDFRSKHLYRVKEVYVSAPSSTGIANLNLSSDDRNNLLGKSFREIGLHAMPFEPQRLPPKERVFTQVDSSERVKLVLRTPSFKSCKYRAKAAIQRLQMVAKRDLTDSLLDTSLVFKADKSKVMPKCSKVTGLVVLREGNLFILTESGRYYWIKNPTGKNLPDCFLPYIGKVCMVSRSIGVQNKGFSFIPLLENAIQ